MGGCFAGVVHSSIDCKPAANVTHVPLASNIQQRSFRPGGKEYYGIAEGLVHGETNDRRQKVDLFQASKKTTQWASNVQIVWKESETARVYGSGFMFGANVIITAAHNVVDDKLKVLQDLEAFQARQAEDVYMRRIEIEKVTVHPKYNGLPSCGFDIAVLTFSDNKIHGGSNTQKFHQSYTADDGFGSETAPVQGQKVRITGYPGDADKIKSMYTHDGSVKKTEDGTILGGKLIYYDVDTTPGNSGSGVRWVTDDARAYVKAIHVAHSTSEKMNYGTLITPDIKKWIETSAANDGFKI